MFAPILATTTVIRGTSFQKFIPRNRKRWPPGFHPLPRRIDRRQNRVVMVMEVSQGSVHLGRRKVWVLPEKFLGSPPQEVMFGCDMVHRISGVPDAHPTASIGREVRIGISSGHGESLAGKKPYLP